VTTLAIAAGGAVGAVLRWRIGVAIGLRGFPWATLLVNVSGCFLLALLLSGPGPARWSLTTTSALSFGLLGSFTTFSTFGWETFTLLRTDEVGRAAAYVALSVAGGVAATALGWVVGRQLA
jgi:fluoride exporter